MNKIQSSVTAVAEGTGRVIKGINRSVTERRENSKVSEALGFLSDKKCKLFKNPANSNDSFGAFYACKENDEKDVFYYLSRKDVVKKEGITSLKQVKTLDYVKGANGSATLSLKLIEGDKEIKLNIPEQGDGGWANFKNVDLSNDCKVVVPELGTSNLTCQLKDPAKEGQTFSYIFSIF